MNRPFQEKGARTKEQDGWACKQKDGMSDAKGSRQGHNRKKEGGERTRPCKGQTYHPQTAHVYTTGYRFTPHSLRMALLIILPYRLFPSPTVPTHPFPEIKGLQG